MSLFGIGRIGALSLLLSASAFAMSGCGASSVAEDDDLESAEDDLTSEQNPIGLRLKYDEQTSTVRATVRSRLRVGEELRLRLRRGRLTSVVTQPLDCLDLPTAPALPDDHPASRTTTRVIYQGPPVDEKTLASVYKPEWIQEHLTPEMLDELSREGADQIVESCIIARDIVAASPTRPRVQTSITYVWDRSDPNRAPIPVPARR